MQKADLDNARSNLKKIWGYSDFRKGQGDAIHSILNGDDTLVLFPTGGGKSICYQLPATLFDGLTIVISPLVALMHDQVNQLNKAGVRAAFINSTIPHYEVEQRLVNARNGMYKLLYMSPERLATNLWKSELENLNISFVAVDEAHCISQWGHEFRPSYRRIRDELESLPESTRWMALTATATPEVRDDIIQSLKFRNPKIVANGFDRENLLWWVTETGKKNQKLQEAVKKGVSKGSGIVYAGTRKECEYWANRFQKTGIAAKAYHAGLPAAVRSTVQQEWLENSIKVVVATNAFGMGIDKPDCRFVLHYNPPYSVEAYYQEAGRAGRDGVESYPVFLFKKSDFDLAKSRILKSYPSYEQLEKSYLAICDELHIAIGNEQEKAEPLKMKSVAKRAQMSNKNIEACLRVLERLNIFEISEYQVPRIGVNFILNSDLIQKFIRESKETKSEFTDKLQRLFGPLSFREYYYLDLPYLLEKLNMNENTFQKALNILAEHDGILRYHWLSEEPLVRLIDTRMRKPRLSREDVEGYRNILLKKLEYMQLYSQTKSCREVFLRRYFGESSVSPCGHCDNCLKRVQADKYNPDKKDIERVRKLLENRKLSLNELEKETKWSGKYTKRIVSFLVREDKIRSNNDPVPLYSWSDSSSVSLT